MASAEAGTSQMAPSVTYLTTQLKQLGAGGDLSAGAVCQGPVLIVGQVSRFSPTPSLHVASPPG